MTSFKTDLSKITHYYSKVSGKTLGAFAVYDGNDLIFSGNAQIPQHQTFLRNVVDKLTSLSLPVRMVA